MKNVLVTGAAGFLGSHLVRHHLDAGDNVLGLDNFSSSDRYSKHFESLLNHKNFQFMLGNVVVPENMITLRALGHYKFKRDKIDVIYNFACPASPPRYQSMPIETMMTCVVGMKNILDLAEEEGSVVVQASTSEIYGEPLVHPQVESYRGNVNSYGPRACYDEGKRAAEALCYDYINLGVDVRIVRIFNTYGPHMDPNDGRVVTNFIKQALRDEDITVYGDGQQTRSFCYVSDLIDGITRMAANAEIKSSTGPINLGNPVEFTMQDLAQRVIDITGSSSDIDHQPLPMDDPSQRCPDISKAREILGWEPQVSLETGLSHTIKYVRQIIQNT